MTDKKTANHIIEQWYSPITKEDKKHSNMPPLFDSLVSRLYEMGIPFDIAHEAVLVGAKKVYPHSLAIKFIYDSSSKKKYQTLQEFSREWCENITKLALQAFYSYYQIESSDKKIPVKRQQQSVESTGMKTDDEMNAEDFWKSVKTVKKDSPWIFGEDDE